MSICIIYTFFIIVLIIGLLVLVFFWNNGTTHKNKDDIYVESVKTLYRQCARWASASLQDEADIIKTLHANYATGYLWALKDIVSNEDFRAITGEDFLKFENTIVTVQDAATKSLVSKCKDLVFVDDPVLYKAIYSRGK